MSIRRLFLGVAVVGSWGLFVPEVWALDSACASKLGDCSVSNAPQDFTSCECSDGSGVAGGGGNEWAGLNQAQLDAVCEEQLAMFCGPPGPLEGVPCESELGTCTVDNEPDSIFCDCANGGGGGGGGGNEWDGLSDEELFGVCLEQLDAWCGVPPDPDWMCENKLGGCSIELGEDVFVSCGCSDGGGGFFPGDPDWGGLSEDELLEVCFGQLDDTCGGVDPSDTDATSGTEEGGSTDGGTESETGVTEGGEETTGGESAETTAAEAGESSSDASDSASASATDSASASDSDSDSASASATDSASASASNTAGAEESSGGGDGGATETPSGCGCDVGNDEPGAALGLGLLGLVGWRIRRRRPQ